MEIVPGLHQIKTPMPRPELPYVLAYAFEGTEGVTLFDAGFGTPEATEALTAGLAACGYRPGAIRRLIISHTHPDHYGMAAWVKEQAPDSELVMSEHEWAWLEARESRGEGWMARSDEWLMRHGMSRPEIDEGHRAEQGWRPGAALSTVRPDRLLEDGETLAFDGWELEAVWTPGHTPGHLCVFERQRRLMLTGDHVLPHISPNVSLHSDQEGTSPLADFRRSLERVASYDTALGLPAHEFTIADLPERCGQLLHHHDDRLDEVARAAREHDGAGSTAREVAERVQWNTGRFVDFPLMMQRSAIGETLSHLQLLADEERLVRLDGDGESGAVRWSEPRSGR